MSTENKAVGTVRFNKEQGGIEIVFAKGTQLDEKHKALLKSKGFRWHRKGQYYYARYTDEVFEWTKQVFASWKPKKNEVASIKATAEKKAAEKPAKAAAKKVSQADRLDRLEQMLTALLESKGVGV